MKRVLFVTGTDTGVGKTVFTCLLTRHLLAAGKPLAALKPFCSGGRDDAEALFQLQRDKLALDEINPWFFKAPLAPLIAARKSRRTVQLKEVVAHVKSVQETFPLIVIEGAGGLLSPLGEEFDANDLIDALHAVPIVVCPNRLGAINQVRLVQKALSRESAQRAQFVLVDSPERDASHALNIEVLREFIGSERIHLLGRINEGVEIPVKTKRMLNALTRQLLS